jgi:DNA replication protein DnaC
MNPMPELAPMLKQLRLSGILDSLDVRNKQAIDKKMAYPEFLALLISDEVARRDQKRFATRLRRASFRSHKTLDQFDFDFNPNINSALVHELIAGRFIEELEFRANLPSTSCFYRPEPGWLLRC